MAAQPDHFDVIVLGAGPAGYFSAIRCAQLGLRTACVDDWTGKRGEHSPGGTFVNAGCIPSLALMDSATRFQSTRDSLGEHGILVSQPSLDLETVIHRKDRIVEDLAAQIGQLFAEHRIECIYGRGRLLAGKEIEVTPVRSQQPERLLSGGQIVLAAGSRPADLSAAPIDGVDIVDSYAAMNFNKVPEHLGIIGAGVIGLEHASVWARFGSRVILFDAQEEFLGFVDKQVVDEVLKIYSREGLDIRFRARVTQARKTGDHVIVDYQDRDGNHQIRLDKLIVAAGRRPNTDGLFAPESDLLLDEQGFVHVDEQRMTNLPGVYAIGDLIQGPMLAHKGAEEGIFVAELIAGKERTIDHTLIPNVIYTDPEIAWVGQSEQQLVASGEAIKTGIFPFAANSCSRALGESDGLVKIISQQQTDRILGVHIAGRQASELIGEAVLAMEFCASTEDLARCVHAHPSRSKALQEAAMSMENRAFHLFNAADR